MNKTNNSKLTGDEMVEVDNPVRGICAIVDSMDEIKLNFIHTKIKRTGRLPYNPICMFKIYLYCYYNKIRSYRNIEKNVSVTLN